MDGVNDGPFERPIESGESVPGAVVMAVSAATGRPLTPEMVGGLDSLSSTIDPDAVDALFCDTGEVRLVFEWAGCRVEIVDGERVVVTRLD